MFAIDAIIHRLRHGCQTMAYPNGAAPALPDRHGGALKVDATRCETGCVECVRACPTQAITRTANNKIALDLGHVETPSDVLVSPSLRIVHPKVESGRERAVVASIGRPEKLVKLLFDSATEKHGGTVLLYDRLPVPSLDTPALMTRRLAAMRALVDRATIQSARSTLCGARNCMDGLLDD